MLITKKRVVKLYLVYVLCMASEVFSRIFSGLGSAASGGKSTFLHSSNSNPILLAFTATLIGWTGWLILPIRTAVVERLLSVPWLTLLYMEAAVSVVWSVEPSASFRYSFYLWSYMLAGLLCSFYLEVEESIGLVGDVTAAMAALSILAQYRFPQVNAAPGWTGIYGEKNHLGISMTVGVVALLLSRRGWTLLRVAKLTLCLSLILLSQSGTAIICTIVSVGLLVALRLAERSRRLLIVLGGGSLLIGFTLIPDLLDRILNLGGKDSTLTGRDVIWRFATKQWFERPVSGWGYSAFWSSQDALVQQNLGWNPYYSHNGFLEIGLSLGMVGEVLVVGLILSAFVLAVRVLRRHSELAGYWLLLSLSIVFLHDLTEVDFLIPGPLWVVFGISLFSAVSARQNAAVRIPAPKAPTALIGFSTFARRTALWPGQGK